MTKLIVIKIGGQAISQLSTTFFDQIAQWYQQHYQILIVHGWGANDQSTDDSACFARA
ncbi:hypothetical protein N574_0117695 [Lactiplantibacillus plantarum 2165]|nr:hypothetical protein N574_0117695 [Lactiplantibacillus plantarum 2165]